MALITVASSADCSIAAAPSKPISSPSLGGASHAALR
jgi:hypothetical protein